MKKAFLECFVIFVLLAVVTFALGAWPTSPLWALPWTLLILWAVVAWSLIGWLLVGRGEDTCQFMRQFLSKEKAKEVLAYKAQHLDDLYDRELRFRQILRHDTENKDILRTLRRRKRDIRKAKKDFWRTVHFAAVEDCLINSRPYSYKDCLPKKNQAA